MNINLELVEELRKRANVSYDDAKDALEKCNGDLLEALIYLEKNKKITTTKPECKGSGFFSSVKSLIKKCHQTKFILTKNENTVIDLPLTIVILVAVFFPPFTLAALIIALFTKHRIRFIKPNGNDLEVNKTLDKVSDAASDITNKVTNLVKNN